MSSEKQSILLLPDIRSAINVGALFRTADAIGISKIYLTGTTPCPTDSFGRTQKDIAKSALGAETWVPWEYKKTLIPVLKNLKKQGFTLIALEQDKKSVDYRTIKENLKKKNLDQKIVIILGQETIGLDKKILSYCDAIVEIPMYGKKESLNVSVACGIALFRILER